MTKVRDAISDILDMTTIAPRNRSAKDVVLIVGIVFA